MNVCPFLAAVVLNCERREEEEGEEGREARKQPMESKEGKLLFFIKRQ